MNVTDLNQKTAAETLENFSKYVVAAGRTEAGDQARADLAKLLRKPLVVDPVPPDRVKAASMLKEAKEKGDKLLAVEEGCSEKVNLEKETIHKAMAQAKLQAQEQFNAKLKAIDEAFLQQDSALNKNGQERQRQTNGIKAEQ